MHFLLSWLILAAAVYVTAAVLPGFHVKGFKSAIWVAALVGVLNFFLFWILFVSLGIVTLGIGFLFGFLTVWVVNAIILKLVDSLTDHLTIDSFGWALGGALMISIIGSIGNHLIM
jgi:putative membrane protein